MGKKNIIGFMTILFIISLVSTAHCDDALKKLGRGICNIGTCPLEVFEQIKRVSNDEGPMAGCSYGVVKGVSMMVVRGCAGVYEFVTFPFPVPKDYRPLLTDPEFFFEEKSW